MKIIHFPKYYQLLSIACSALCCVALSGCMSTLDALNPLADNKPDQPEVFMYQTSKDGWQRAAFRQNDLFNRYELKIFASVNWKKRSDAATYTFDAIQIADQSDAYAINLLHPQFDGKMACGWYCEYVDLPITQPMVGAYTMLDKIYQSRQPELLNFYASLTQLNERLISIDPRYLHLMPDIIARIAAMKIEFDSLAHVIGFLNDYFDELNFETEFANKPALDGIIASHRSAGSAFASDEQYIEDTGTVIINTLPDPRLPEPRQQQQNMPRYSRESAQYLNAPNPDRALLESFQTSSPMPHMAQSRQTNRRPVSTQLSGGSYYPQPAPPSAGGSNNNSGAQIKGSAEDSLWTGLSQEEVNVGQLVCSYEDNYFGRVQSIEGETVNVAIQGQAKAVKDGMFINAAIGILFQASADFSYLQTEDFIAFAAHQVAPCNLSGF
ncbi:MAG: hypothetical protein ACI8WB_004321 [Phenylobacterium sp.]|jgi:hypothetical protein